MAFVQKNASEFHDISVREFQFGETTEERRLDAYDCLKHVFFNFYTTNATKNMILLRRKNNMEQTTEYQEVKGNREVKSSLFAKIFSDKKELLELFNAVNGTEAQ